MAERLHVTIEGRVQGIGFRYATYRRAVELGLGGWVRNIEDGRVEAESVGPRDALEQMLHWCRRGPSLAHVTRVDEAWSADDAPSHSGFHIRG